MTTAERIVPAFARFHGWTYGYPVAVPPGIAAPTGDPARDRLPGVPASVPIAYEPHQRRTVCTGLTAWCVLFAYPELRVEGAWADLQIADPVRPWSPLERVANLGDGIAEEPAVGWWLTQTWSGLGRDDATGHARLVHVRDDGLTVYEASRRHGIRTRDYAPRGWLTWGERTRWALLR